MSMVATKKLLFLLADAMDRTYYFENGVVKKNVIPTWMKNNPNGWKDMTLQWATNLKYFSTVRAFSTAITFVKDGQQILADRMLNGAGTEEIIYLIILRQDPTMGLNGFKLEYKSRLDLSKFNGDARKGIAINTLQDDVFAEVMANENTNYSLQCNGSNPAAIKVLFDGTLLQDKFNYSVIAAPMVESTTAKEFFAIPFVFINNEGDSSGVISNSPNFDNFADPVAYVSYPANSNFSLQFNEDTVVRIKGSFSFTMLTLPPFTFIKVFFMKSTDGFPVPAEQMVLSKVAADLADNKVFTSSIDISIDLPAGVKLFFLAQFAAFKVIPVATNISFMFASKNTPTVNFALRPLDALKQLVSLITKGRYTADSKFLAANNRKVMLSGSSLRSFQDAVIYTNFSDFYQSYAVPYNLGLAVRNGVLYLEPVEDLYNSSKELINLGNISEAHLTVAEEFMYNSVKVGYIKQTYNKRNGRYEYNCTHTYKFPINTVLNQLNLVSPYRADSFGMEFIRTGYPNLDTTDDKGDADVFTVMISDAVGQANAEVDNAVAITVETLITANPIIKTPFTNSTVYNANPTITGLSQPFKTITVFTDGVVDGTTVANAAGKWSYQIVTPLRSLSLVFNGVHVIEATAQTDMTDISGFSNAISLIVNTAVTSAFLITAPSNNDTLYNNLPVISGIAPSGKVITIRLDGVIIGTAVTNSSGLWNFGIFAPIADGVHVIIASTPGMADAPAFNFTVNKNVSTPLITSMIYGDIIYNNLPLIKGVAIPGTVVPIYIDGGGGPIVGGIAGPAGTAVADANGDWSFQVVTVTDSSGIVTPYIPDGLHIICTTATPVEVLTGISGYRLMRGSNKGPVMDYDAIKLDDQYIPVGIDPSTLPATLGQFLHPETLYNIEETSPLRCLLAHANVLSGFLFQQKGQQILFNGAEVNANLTTKKDNLVFNEGAAVNVNDLAIGIYYYFYLNFKANVPFTFNDIMTAINNDGYITTIFKGVPVYVLPIGTMNMKIATNEAQQFKCLVSTKTPLSSLLQLFGTGISISIGKNMIYLSDKNPLHFVEYNYTPPEGFHFKDIYDDWQKNRFPTYITRSLYVQPFMKTDPLALQAINTGSSNAQIQVVSATTGLVIDAVNFVTVAGKIQLPNLLQQCLIDLSGYPEDEYWFALFAGGTIVAISEMISLKTDWENTLAFDYGGSLDDIDYYFSTGILPRIRIQALMHPWFTEAEVENYEDENGDFEITRGVPIRMRTLQLGDNTTLIPEWMAIKMNEITILDNYKIDGIQYTRDNNSKMNREDLGTGVVDCLIKMEIILAQNQRGKAFATPGDTGIQPVTFALDATAFGQNAGVINVTADVT